MGRLIAKILAWLAILLGLALLIQPTAAQWWTSTRNAKTAAQFAARAEAQPTAPAAEETAAEPPEPERAYPELYAAMQDYNAEIYAGGQSGLTDPFAYEEAPLDLAAYGYDGDVLAVLWIPRLNLELPVYLGASRENLAKGAALLGQTSMPLGGENTNTVIAAHRGYYGAEMLRNVQQIQVGDKIQLTTPWETLIYRVSELKIIDPSDINAVLIQPGRDLLTLSTCGDTRPDTDTRKALVRYAAELGLVFQIVDDILDVTSTTEELGKPVGSDADNDKTTFITLYGLQGAHEEAERHNAAALAALDALGPGADFLRLMAAELLERKK